MTYDIKILYRGIPNLRLLNYAAVTELRNTSSYLIAK